MSVPGVTPSLPRVVVVEVMHGSRCCGISQGLCPEDAVRVCEGGGSASSEIVGVGCCCLPLTLSGLGEGALVFVVHIFR